MTRSAWLAGLAAGRHALLNLVGGENAEGCGDGDEGNVRELCEAMSWAIALERVEGCVNALLAGNAF